MKLKDPIWAKGRKSSRGQTLTEYSLVVLFVALAAYSAYTGLGTAAKGFTNNLVTFINTAVAAL